MSWILLELGNVIIHSHTPMNSAVLSVNTVVESRLTLVKYVIEYSLVQGEIACRNEAWIDQEF